jgi:Ca2+-binding EF-hand superfamily protein
MKRFSIIGACLLGLLLTGTAFAQEQTGAQGQRKGGKAKLLQKLDADSDGKIARAEWQGRAKGFDRLDANGDGFITREEVGATAFAKLDANSDQRIARDEWKGKARAFNRLDADNDGFLTAEELSRRRKP